jgi:ATP phosphoribosyltransferase
LVDSLGATEAYPFTGSAELISDISSTGETLKANNLRVLKDGKILNSQACIFTSKKNSKKKGLNNLIKSLSK